MEENVGLNKNENVDLDELLTIEEIAGKMKVPISFFYAPCHRKGPAAIPCIRVGKHLRYHFPTVRAHFAAKSGAR
ncbi:MAG: hypothetical protein WAU61_06325 [Smithella sp.]